MTLMDTFLRRVLYTTLRRILQVRQPSLLLIPLDFFSGPGDILTSFGIDPTLVVGILIRLSNRGCT
jgi:hypothetical protein